MHTHAWRLTPDGEYHWERVELPPLQAGEALIRLRACGLCTGEVMDWYTLRKAPLTPIQFALWNALSGHSTLLRLETAPKADIEFGNFRGIRGNSG